MKTFIITPKEFVSGELMTAISDKARSEQCIDSINNELKSHLKSKKKHKEVLKNAKRVLKSKGVKI